MVNIEVVREISSNLRRGLPYDQIYQNLLMKGYSDFEINEARDFILSGGIVPSGVDSARRYTPNQFLLMLAVIAFIVLAFMIFGMLFSEIGEKSIRISGDSLVDSVDLELVKNNKIFIENFRGKDYNFSVVYKSGIFVFEGKDVNFSLSSGEKSDLDLDLDGDYDLEFFHLGGGNISIVEICEESWSCSDWSECVLGIKKRSCTDLNSCGTMYMIPDTEIECISAGLPYDESVSYSAEIVSEKSYTYYVSGESGDLN
jgi:hypothetical protein